MLSVARENINRCITCSPYKRINIWARITGIENGFYYDHTVLHNMLIIWLETFCIQ